MNMGFKICWLLLGLIHAPPAAVILWPSAVTRLYGVQAGGDVAILLVHRGALFLALCALCIFAVLDEGVRRAASLAIGISVLGFLAIYMQSGAPAGPLRLIAIADALALAPLVAVAYGAWR